MFFAHTGVSKYEIKPQTYQDHVGSMLKQGFDDSKILQPYLRRATLLAILFHDLGKLHPYNQSILSREDRVEGEHLINHVDAGVAHCLNQYNLTKDGVWVISAFLIHAHHIGLQDQDTLFSVQKSLNPLEFMTQKPMFSFEPDFRDSRIQAETDELLPQFLEHHAEALSDYSDLVKEVMSLSASYPKVDPTPMDLRFALSVLVDCDHSDSARHQGGPSFFSRSLRASSRIKVLDFLVERLQIEGLKQGVSKKALESRNLLYRLCSEAEISSNFYTCSAPVGKGKTSAMAKFALRLAEEHGRERIFTIIPLTNIISQTVKVYRQMLLPGEDPFKTVSEIHSKVEFHEWWLRVYAHTWDAPINVSTSVQFFQALLGNHPVALRKLKQFANSVIILDEYHQALPDAHMWALALKALGEMAEKYNIDVIFGSGTHVHFWEIFQTLPYPVQSIVPDSVYEDFKNEETSRINFQNLGVYSSDMQLLRDVESIIAPSGDLVQNALIVMSTVKNAVVFTYKLIRLHPEWKIFHLSSHLAPQDREPIMSKIHAALKGSERIILIATSLVECGLDFSFWVGFREEGSLMSIIQCGGRVNRGSEFGRAPFFEFSFSSDFIKGENGYSRNLDLRPAILARRGLAVDPDNCTQAIENEIQIRDRDDMLQLEASKSYKSVARKFQVIKKMSQSVIVDPEIVAKIKAGEKVSSASISRASVSIYDHKLDPNLKDSWAPYVQSFDNTHGESTLYWTGPYDKTMFWVSALLVDTMQDFS